MNCILTRTSYMCFHIPARKCMGPSLVLHFSGVNKFVLSNYSSVLRPCTLTKPGNVTHLQVRNAVSGFFNKQSASEIWKAVSSVSNAGRRRGRGKIRGRKVIKDLNKGQVIGIGKENIRFPGLSSPIIRGRELVQRQKLPVDENYQENLIKFRQPVTKLKKHKVAPIDRGWTGGHAEGRKVGAPDPIGDATFDGFESVILEQKPVFHMTQHFGRFRTVFGICATGNSNGLFGYALATATDAKSAIGRAKNRAGQKLMFIPRHEDRTVVHNFCSRFYNTRVFVWKQAPGYGLRCHRLLKSCCELMGIKDLYAKVEGGSSTLNILNAFLLGLLRQKSYEELASETNMHVVEMNQQNSYFPKLVASPERPLESSDEPLDFDLYCFDNNVFARNKKYPPRYTTLRRWPIEVRKRENQRALPNARLQLMVEYGSVQSFLTEKFPECKPSLPPWSRVMKEKKKAEEGAE